MIRKVSVKRLRTNVENKFIDVEVNYNRGDWGGKRGFYISVSPIKVDGVFEMYVGFTGYKHCVLEAERFSQKLANVAIENAKKQEQELIDIVCSEQHLKVI